MIFEMRSPEATFALGEELGRQARPGDIILTVGAGDVYKIGEHLVKS